MRKKMLSLSLFICILLNVLTLAVPVHAAKVTSGINTYFTEDENGIITATVCASNIDNFSGLTWYLGYDHSKVLLLEKSIVVVNSKFYDWVYTGTTKSDGLKLMFAATSTDQYISITNETPLFEVYFRKNSDWIDETTFYYFKQTIKACSYVANNTRFSSREDGAFGMIFQIGKFVVPVSSVTLNATPTTLSVGQTRQLTATCFPANATYKGVTWHSSNPTVATVNANGVVTAKNAGTATITATSSNGKKASCNIAVASQNRISYNDYQYKFDNSPDSFGYDYHYNIQGEQVIDYKIPVKRYWQAGLKNPFRYLAALGNWGGSCFGMSASSILFYKNDIAEERYDSGVSIPGGFKAPTSDDYSDKKLREMIELMQVSQLRGYNTKEWFWTPGEIASQIDLGNPVLMTLGAGISVGHAVVIYDYYKQDGYYIFSIYDCSKFVDYLVINDDKKGYFLYNEREGANKYDWKISGFIFYDEISQQLNKIRDGLLNNAASLFFVEPTYTYLFRDAGNIKIFNSQGLTADIINDELSGTIDDVKVVPASYLAEKPVYTIILPNDNYTITGIGDDEATTMLADDYMSVEITHKSSVPITVSKDLHEIKLENSGTSEFTIKYTTFDNIFDEMILTGTSNGEITTKLDGTDVIVTGADTLTATATISGEEVSKEATALSQYESVTVACQESDVTTLQIFTGETELTEQTALPERIQVVAPEHDLESGSYEAGQTLTFTDDEETVIYYTTDGSIPFQDNGIIYSFPIEINKSMTVKAIATKYGYLDSDVVTLEYTLPQVAPPYANYTSGEYDTVLELSLTSNDLEDKIYYTLDGTDPFENGVLYTVPIHLFEDAELAMYTVHNGCVSEINEYSYTISHEKPFFFENTAVNQNNEIITLDNIGTLTDVKVTVGKLLDGEQTGNFAVALYDENGKLVALSLKEATVSEENETITLPIFGNTSTAVKMKVMVMDSDAKPIGNLQEQFFASEAEDESGEVTE